MFKKIGTIWWKISWPRWVLFASKSLMALPVFHSRTITLSSTQVSFRAFTTCFLRSLLAVVCEAGEEVKLKKSAPSIRYGEDRWLVSAEDFFKPAPKPLAKTLVTEM